MESSRLLTTEAQKERITAMHSKAKEIADALEIEISEFVRNRAGSLVWLMRDFKTKETARTAKYYDEMQDHVVSKIDKAYNEQFQDERLKNIIKQGVARIQ